jgi:cytochrome c-type biogenesis protein CcmF
MQLTRDVFGALGEDLGAGRWSVRAQVRPLISFVWLAAFLMALGGVIAACDRRYRVALPSPEATPVPPVAAVPPASARSAARGDVLPGSAG